MRDGCSRPRRRKKKREDEFETSSLTRLGLNGYSSVGMSLEDSSISLSLSFISSCLS